MTRSRRREIPKKGGAEWDCFTAWRRLYCYLGRAGVAKSIKRQYNKRARKTAKGKGKGGAE